MTNEISFKETQLHHIHRKQSFVKSQNNHMGTNHEPKITQDAKLAEEYAN